jgi:hypothetical protein
VGTNPTEVAARAAARCDTINRCFVDIAVPLKT